MESSLFLPVPGPPQKPESSRSSPPLEPQHPWGAGDVQKERGSAPSSFPNPALTPLALLSPLQGSVPAASWPRDGICPTAIEPMAIKALSQITEMPLKFKSSQAADNTTPPTPEGPVWSHIQGSPALFWSVLSCGAHGTFGQMWDLQLDVGLRPGLGSARLRCSAPETCVRVKSTPMQGKEGAAGAGKHGSKCPSSFQTPYPRWGSP